MAKTLDRPQEPVFGTVKVTPSHAPPAGLIRPEPFIQPTTLPQPADTALASPATDPVPHGSTTTSKASSSGLPELAQPRQKRSATAFDISKKDASSIRNRTACLPTILLLLSFRRKGNCQTIWRQMHLIMISPSRRSNPTEKL